MTGPPPYGITLSPYDAVIFDCDGVLADTDDAWGLAERLLCERHGVPWSDELRHRTHGLSNRASVALFAELMEAPPPLDRLERELLALATPILRDGASPLPGAVELVQGLAEHLPVGVASNTPRVILDGVLAALGLRGPLSAVVAADEVAAPKPAPDVYREAARRLGVDPSTALVFEDSPAGVMAALRAGCRVVGVAAVGRPRLNGVLSTVADLRHAGALLLPTRS
ncbi:HAD family hydrolase [Actinomadura sp. HBU206391]|uniref:HAD family hydrolase n=1 Tax=Actinomadura sp. HBU206391 TaxID=2731692 RepID=UPI001650577C|nr:HAD family phosphatase [Actinomadura sp. HBU206391]MBC6463211.1 HAD family phosphatase [Actinomadura sp. HBU206391]